MSEREEFEKWCSTNIFPKSWLEDDGAFIAWQACAERKQREIDELAAQVEVTRKYGKHQNNEHGMCNFLRHSQYACSCGYEAALSIPGPAALAEVKARTLEEAADKFDKFDADFGNILPDEIRRLSKSACEGAARDLRNMAASIRKGE